MRRRRNRLTQPDEVFLSNTDKQEILLELQADTQPWQHEDEAELSEEDLPADAMVAWEQLMAKFTEAETRFLPHSQATRTSSTPPGTRRLGQRGSSEQAQKGYQTDTLPSTMSARLFPCGFSSPQSPPAGNCPERRQRRTRTRPDSRLPRAHPPVPSAPAEQALPPPAPSSIWNLLPEGGASAGSVSAGQADLIPLRMLPASPPAGALSASVLLPAPVPQSKLDPPEKYSPAWVDEWYRKVLIELQLEEQSQPAENTPPTPLAPPTPTARTPATLTPPSTLVVLQTSSSPPPAPALQSTQDPAETNPVKRALHQQAKQLEQQEEQFGVLGACVNAMAEHQDARLGALERQMGSILSALQVMIPPTANPAVQLRHPPPTETPLPDSSLAPPTPTDEPADSFSMMVSRIRPEIPKV
nr:uncharacterized protein LOC133615775 [Nerophis lumbriciformis]